MSMQSFKPV